MTGTLPRPDGNMWQDYREARQGGGGQGQLGIPAHADGTDEIGDRGCRPDWTIQRSKVDSGYGEQMKDDRERGCTVQGAGGV